MNKNPKLSVLKEEAKHNRSQMIHSSNDPNLSITSNILNKTNVNFPTKRHEIIFPSVKSNGFHPEEKKNAISHSDINIPSDNLELKLNNSKFPSNEFINHNNQFSNNSVNLNKLKNFEENLQPSYNNTLQSKKMSTNANKIIFPNEKENFEKSNYSIYCNDLEDSRINQNNITNSVHERLNPGIYLDNSIFDKNKLPNNNNNLWEIPALTKEFSNILNESKNLNNKSINNPINLNNVKPSDIRNPYFSTFNKPNLNSFNSPNMTEQEINENDIIMIEDNLDDRITSKLVADEVGAGAYGGKINYCNDNTYSKINNTESIYEDAKSEEPSQQNGNMGAYGKYVNRQSSIYINNESSYLSNKENNLKTFNEKITEKEYSISMNQKYPFKVINENLPLISSEKADNSIEFPSEPISTGENYLKFQKDSNNGAKKVKENDYFYTLKKTEPNQEHNENNILVSSRIPDNNKISENIKNFDKSFNSQKIYQDTQFIPNLRIKDEIFGKSALDLESIHNQSDIVFTNKKLQEENFFKIQDKTKSNINISPIPIPNKNYHQNFDNEIINLQEFKNFQLNEEDCKPVDMSISNYEKNMDLNNNNNLLADDNNFGTNSFFRTGINFIYNPINEQLFREINDENKNNFLKQLLETEQSKGKLETKHGNETNINNFFDVRPDNSHLNFTGMSNNLFENQRKDSEAFNIKMKIPKPNLEFNNINNTINFGEKIKTIFDEPNELNSDTNQSHKNFRKISIPNNLNYSGYFKPKIINNSQFDIKNPMLMNSYSNININNANVVNYYNFNLNNNFNVNHDTQIKDFDVSLDFKSRFNPTQHLETNTILKTDFLETEKLNHEEEKENKSNIINESEINNLVSSKRPTLEIPINGIIEEFKDTERKLNKSFKNPDMERENWNFNKPQIIENAQNSLNRNLDLEELKPDNSLINQEFNPSDLVSHSIPKGIQIPKLNIEEEYNDKNSEDNWLKDDIHFIIKNHEEQLDQTIKENSIIEISNSEYKILKNQNSIQKNTESLTSLYGKEFLKDWKEKSGNTIINNKKAIKDDKYFIQSFLEGSNHLNENGIIESDYIKSLDNFNLFIQPLLKNPEGNNISDLEDLFVNNESIEDSSKIEFLKSEKLYVYETLKKKATKTLFNKISYLYDNDVLKQKYNLSNENIKLDLKDETLLFTSNTNRNIDKDLISQLNSMNDINSEFNLKKNLSIINETDSASETKRGKIQINKDNNNDGKIHFFRESICDGNSFYRMFMFSYFENLIINKNVTLLAKIFKRIQMDYSERNILNNRLDLKYQLEMKYIFQDIDIERVIIIFNIIVNLMRLRDFSGAYRALLNAFNDNNGSFDKVNFIILF